MQDSAPNSCTIYRITTKKSCISARLLELIPGFEPGTSSLPKCTRTRRNERINVIRIALYEHSYWYKDARFLFLQYVLQEQL